MVPLEKPFLTVVSGLPRSGTSMMMMMIEAGGIPVLTDRIRRPDEDNPKGYYEYEPVKRTKADASWVRDGVGKVVKVVHLLLSDLPVDHAYRIVLMRRNLDEVLASQRTMLERQGQKGSDLHPERLATIFAGQLDKLTVSLRQVEHIRLLEVHHGNVIRDPHGQAERVNAFLDGGLNVETMATVVDASLYRQRGAKKES